MKIIDTDRVEKIVKKNGFGMQCFMFEQIIPMSKEMLQKLACYTSTRQIKYFNHKDRETNHTSRTWRDDGEKAEADANNRETTTVFMMLKLTFLCWFR